MTEIQRASIQEAHPSQFSQKAEKADYPAQRERFKQSVAERINKTTGNVVITSHTMPDDDAVCSALAFRQILAKQFPDKAIQVVLSEKPIDAWNRLLPIRDAITWAASKKVQGEGENERPGDVMDHVKAGDTLICLDGGTFDRFSKFQDALENDPPFHTIILDHHRDKASAASISYVEPEATATCELLAHMYDAETLDPSTATLLLLGILNDTRNFTLDSDYTEVKKVAEKLQSKSGKTFEEITALVARSEQEKEYYRMYASHVTHIDRPGTPKISYAYITPKEKNATKPTTNAAYDHFIARRDFMYDLSQKGESDLYWTISPIMTEGKPTKYSVSFRRKNGTEIDLHALAQQFGGAGHGGAAAGTFELSKDHIIHIKKQKAADKAFDDTIYACGLILDKVTSLLSAPETSQKQEIIEEPALAVEPTLQEEQTPPVEAPTPVEIVPQQRETTPAPQPPKTPYQRFVDWVKNIFPKKRTPQRA